MYSPEITCSQVTTIANGKVTGNDFSIFKSVQFSCDHGYTLQGSSNITCMQSGNWSSILPQCRGMYHHQ